MSDIPKSIVINGETITPEMVKRVEWDQPAIETMGPGDGRRYYAPWFVTYVTLHLHDGRVLKTEVYN